MAPSKPNNKNSFKKLNLNETYQALIQEFSQEESQIP